MYKILDEVIKFIEKIMKTWREGGKNLAETMIQKGIIQGDELSPLLFVIMMMPLNHIPRKCAGGYKLSKSQEKIINMDDIKLFAKNKKELETLIHAIRIYSQDIRMEFGIEKCALLIMKSAKRHMSVGMELPNQEKLESWENRKPTNIWEYWKLTPSNK